MTATGSTLAYTDALRLLVQSFQHGRLDYCNAVLIGTDEVTVERCGSFMSGSQRRDHATTILKSLALYWL